MDSDHVDALARAVHTRRCLVTRSAGFGASTLAAALGLGHPLRASAKCKKQCGPCKRCKKGKCKKRKPDGTVCGPDQVCSGGACLVPACGVGGPCRVFVSSTHHDGNLGGLGGADATCQSLAAGAGLPGTYQAWLSDDTSSPSTRFVPSSGPYRLVTGTTIAANFTDLTDGTLLASINVTESGGAVAFPDDLAWTNTRIDGARDDDNKQCANWSSNANLNQGGVGRARKDAFWTEAAFGNCDSAFHLYCFQQS